jgi:thioredoxin 1
MLSPVIEELAKEYSGRVAVYKMNTEVHPAAASRLGISAIPNLLFLKGGKVVNQFVGVRSKADIKKALDQLASE